MKTLQDILDENEQDKILDKYFEVKYSLWNALIILNSLLLSSVSVIFIIVPNINKTIVITLFALNLSSIIGIIINYILMKTNFKRFYDFDKRFENTNTPHKFVAKENKYFIRVHQMVRIMELCSIIFSVISLIIIFLVLIISKNEIS